MIFLQTDRLTLRDYVSSDWREVARLHSDPDVRRYIVDAMPTSPFEATAFINVVRKLHAETPTLGIWRVSKSENDEFLGNFSLMPLADTDDIEIGGRLLKIAWGSGYSIEGGQALLKYAFDQLKRERVVSMCHPDNRAAAMSLVALGFLREGTTHHYERELPFYVLRANRWRQQAALGLSWRKLARLNIGATRPPINGD